MSTTGVDVFDTTLQKTNAWLTELGRTLETQSRRVAYEALRGVLHALRDRLPIADAAHLGAQLPMLVRGIYYEGWRGQPPSAERHLAQFLEHVRRAFPPNTTVKPEAATRAVFALLHQRISQGEAEDVKHVLPQELRALWP